MNDIHLAIIAELEDVYTRTEGIAQFSWYRFACFVIENEPALTEVIVSDALERIGHQHAVLDCLLTPAGGDPPAAAA